MHADRRASHAAASTSGASHSSGVAPAHRSAPKLPHSSAISARLGALSLRKAAVTASAAPKAEPAAALATSAQSMARKDQQHSTQQQEDPPYVQGFAGIQPSISTPKTNVMQRWGQSAQQTRRAGMALQAAPELHSSYVDDITPEAPEGPDALRRLSEEARRSEASSVREPQLELVGAASGSPGMSHSGASTVEAVAYTGLRQGEDSMAAASVPVRPTDLSDGDREASSGGGFGSSSKSAWDVSGPGLKAEYSSSSSQASQVTSMRPSSFRARMLLLTYTQRTGLQVVLIGTTVSHAPRRPCLKHSVLTFWC